MNKLTNSSTSPIVPRPPLFPIVPRYYGARYYDPAIGRFNSADTIVPDPSDPQSLNRYSYVNNDPLRYVDPTGHMGESGDGEEGNSNSGIWNMPVADGYITMRASATVFHNADGAVGVRYGSLQLTFKAEPAEANPVERFRDGVLGALERSAMSHFARGDSTSAFIATMGYKAAEFMMPSSVYELPLMFAGPLKIVKGAGKIGAAARGERLIYRSASGTPASLTPRAVDAKGLSAADSLKNALPGKNQVIDTSKFKSLCAVCDNPATGHFSITPKDMSQMPGWINSRGGTEIHPLTQELMDAVVGTVRK